MRYFPSNISATPFCPGRLVMLKWTLSAGVWNKLSSILWYPLCMQVLPETVQVNSLSKLSWIRVWRLSDGSISRLSMYGKGLNSLARVGATVETTTDLVILVLLSLSLGLDILSSNPLSPSPSLSDKAREGLRELLVTIFSIERYLVQCWTGSVCRIYAVEIAATLWMQISLHLGSSWLGILSWILLSSIFTHCNFLFVSSSRQCNRYIPL